MPLSPRVVKYLEKLRAKYPKKRDLTELLPPPKLTQNPRPSSTKPSACQYPCRSGSREDRTKYGHGPEGYRQPAS